MGMKISVGFSDDKGLRELLEERRRSPNADDSSAAGHEDRSLAWPVSDEVADPQSQGPAWAW